MFLYAMANHEGNPAATMTLVVMMVLAVIFFGLWIWGKTAPFAAILTALIIFVSVHALDAVLDPMALFRGIILKIVMLTGMCTALKKAYEAKRERELSESQN